MSTPDSFITSVAGADYEEIYQKIKPRALALNADSLTFINLDVPTVVLTAIGVIPKLAPFVETVKSLPGYDYQEFQSLREYTLALHSIQAKHTHALAPKEQLPELLAEATKRRDIYLGDCAALIAHGILNKGCIAEYKGLTGYKNVAFDLTGLVELLTESWSQIEGKTMITKAELDDTRLFALRFVEAVAYRDQSPDKVAELGDLRQRIYTLFFRCYDQVRRAIIFLRWDQGDADTIVPSFYAGRGGNGRKQQGTDIAQTTEPAVTSTEPAATTPVASEPVVAAKLPVGHPESLPFTTA